MLDDGDVSDPDLVREVHSGAERRAWADRERLDVGHITDKGLGRWRWYRPVKIGDRGGVVMVDRRQPVRRQTDRLWPSSRRFAGVVDALADDAILLAFLVVGLGAGLGAVRIKVVSLGPAAALFVVERWSRTRSSPRLGPVRLR